MTTDVGTEWVLTTDRNVTAKILYTDWLYGNKWITYGRVHGNNKTVRSVSRESFVGSFEPKPTFFRLGKTYKVKKANSISYLIKELYLVENPASESMKHVALCLASGPEGDWMDTLSIHDFNVMEESE